MQRDTLFRQPRLVLGMAFVLVSVLAAGCAPVLAVAMPATDANATRARQAHPEPAKRQLLREFEVAEDPNRFVFDTAIVDANGMPAHGSTFITQGYIYPAGALNGSNGVLADGSPEFPDKVLGEVPAAIIQPRDGHVILEEEILEFCRDQQLVGYKIPKYVFFLKEYPTTGSGKIQKYRLREMSPALLESHGYRPT